MLHFQTKPQHVRLAINAPQPLIGVVVVVRPMLSLPFAIHTRIQRRWTIKSPDALMGSVISGFVVGCPIAHIVGSSPCLNPCMARSTEAVFPLRFSASPIHNADSVRNTLHYNVQRAVSAQSGVVSLAPLGVL